jgi:hypothetical protein
VTTAFASRIAAFVASSRQAFVGDFRPKLFQPHGVALSLCLSASLGSLGVTGKSDITPAIDRIGSWLSHEQKRQRKKVMAAWKLFRKQKSSWKPASGLSQ